MKVRRIKSNPFLLYGTNSSIYNTPKYNRFLYNNRRLYNGGYTDINIYGGGAGSGSASASSGVTTLSGQTPSNPTQQQGGGGINKRLGIGGIFQQIGEMGEGIGNKISEGSYDEETGLIKKGQYKLGRAIYGAFNPAMAGIEAINRGDSFGNTLLAFTGIGNLVGAGKHADKHNKEARKVLDEKERRIAEQKEIEKQNQINANIQSVYSGNYANYMPYMNTFRAFGGTLDNPPYFTSPNYSNYVSPIRKQNRFIDRNDYDYESAINAGMTPDETGHWVSMLPIDKNTSMWLKRDNHPTRGMTIMDNELMNWGTYRSEDGRLYSYNRKPKKLQYGGYSDMKYNRLLANGGMTTSIPDSNAIRLDKNAELVVNDQGGVGGTHEQGHDIPAYTQDGQVSSMVEPGEVVMELPDSSKYALSKRLGVAQKYLELLNAKEELRKKMLATDMFKRNELQRELDKIDQQIYQLPAYQEQLKRNYGLQDGMGQDMGQVPQFARGGRLPKHKKNKLNNDYRIEGEFDDRFNLFTPDKLSSSDNRRIGRHNHFSQYSYFPGRYDKTKKEDYSNVRTDLPLGFPDIDQKRIGGYSSFLYNPTPMEHDYIIPTFRDYRDIPALAPESRVNINDIEFFNDDKPATVIDEDTPLDNTTRLDNTIYDYIYSGGQGGGGGSGKSKQINLSGKEVQNRGNKKINIGNIGQIADIAVPLIDNVVNAILTSKTPKIPYPNLDTPAIVEDRVNIDPQLSAIQANRRESIKSIDNTVSNLSHLNQLKRRISANAIDRELGVINNKQNIERSLRDANARSIAATQVSNNRLLDAYNMNVAMRKHGMHQDYSANLADLTKDYYNYMNRKDLERSQDIELAAITKLFNDPVNKELFKGLNINNRYDLMAKSKIDIKNLYKNATNTKQKALIEEVASIRNIDLKD